MLGKPNKNYVIGSEVYEDAAGKLEVDIEAKVNTEELEIEAKGMTYLGNQVRLTSEEVDAYAEANDAHLYATAEKLRCDMSKLAGYVQHAERRLRDLIQLKVAADLKLLRDIKRFGQFELQKWQIGALPSGKHVCECTLCRMPDYGGVGSGVPDTFPEFTEGTREEALPQIKLEDEDVPRPAPRKRSKLSKLISSNDHLGSNHGTDADDEGGTDVDSLFGPQTSRPATAISSTLFGQTDFLSGQPDFLSGTPGFSLD